MRSNAAIGGRLEENNKFRRRSRSSSFGRNNEINKRLNTGVNGQTSNGVTDVLSSTKIVLPAGELNAPLITFRAFMLLQDDNIDPDEAHKEYEKYKSDFEVFHAKEFYERNKYLADMMERYHPNMMALQHGKQCLRSQMNSEIFIEGIKNDKYTGIKWALPVDAPSNYNASPDSNPLTWSMWTDTVEYAMSYNGVTPPLFLRMPLENCLQIENISETITKWDVADALKELPGLVDVFATENMGGPRTLWCCFYNAENKAAALEYLNTSPTIIDSMQINAVIPELPDVVSLSVAPPIMSHPHRIAEDTKTSLQLIQHFNRVYCNTTTEETYDANSSNIDMIASVFEEISDPVERLDAQLLYLRTVHNMCYYTAERYSDELQPWKHKCVYMVRADIALWDSIDVASNEQKEWASNFDVKIQKLMDDKIEIPEKITASTPAVKEEWAVCCSSNTVKLSSGAHRCRLCQKSFLLAANVEKHVEKKHAGMLANIIKTAAHNKMRESYMADPNKPVVYPTRKEGMDPYATYSGLPHVQQRRFAFEGGPGPRPRFHPTQLNNDVYYEHRNAAPFMKSGHLSAQHRHPFRLTQLHSNIGYRPPLEGNHRPFMHLREPVGIRPRAPKPYVDFDDVKDTVRQAVKEVGSRPLISYDDL